MKWQDGQIFIFSFHIFKINFFKNEISDEKMY